MVTRAKLNLFQYHKMIDAGIFKDERIEFIDGELIEMPPEKPIHAGSSNQLHRILDRGLGDAFAARLNAPITLDNSEPEPDIIVARFDLNFYKDRHPHPEDILLVIEVSNSTLDYDLGEKLAVYADAGIPEYWVLDVRNKKLYIFTEPLGNNYSVTQELTTGIVSFQNVSIDLDSLFA